MENFGKYLESKRIVSKKRVPFYVAWVSQFFKFVDKKSTEEITYEEVERFLKHLTKKREEWQVTQAEKAIRIYPPMATLKYPTCGHFKIPHLFLFFIP